MCQLWRGRCRYRRHGGRVQDGKLLCRRLGRYLAFCSALVTNRYYFSALYTGIGVGGAAGANIGRGRNRVASDVRSLLHQTHADVVARLLHLIGPPLRLACHSLVEHRIPRLVRLIITVPAVADILFMFLHEVVFDAAEMLASGAAFPLIYDSPSVGVLQSELFDERYIRIQLLHGDVVEGYA